jgi:hypothetical protein
MIKADAMPMPPGSVEIQRRNGRGQHRSGQ